MMEDVLTMATMAALQVSVSTSGLGAAALALMGT